MTNETAQPTNVGSNDQLGLVAERAKVGDTPLCEQMQVLQARAAKLRPIDLEDAQLDADDPYTRLFLLAEYWKAQATKASEERADIQAALQWYADGLHFDKASPDAWDTVSGEPQNWWCDEAGTATVEDGSIAAMTLRGELTAAQIQALD